MQQATFWDGRAAKYDEDIRTHDSLYARTIAGTTSLLTTSDVVLDLGCGSAEIGLDRSGPRNLDRGLSEISIVFQAAVPKPVAPKYTTSGVRRPSAL